MDFYTYVAQSSTEAIGDIANVAKSLNVNKAPFDSRYLVLDPTSHASYSVLDAILGLDKSGSTDALRLNSMGRVLGLETFMDQNIVGSHSGGAGTVKVDITTGTSGYAAGVSAIHVDGLTNALSGGDILTIGSYNYTVVTAGALDTADQDVTIYPPLAAAISNDDAVTVVGVGKSQSMAFHRNAIVLASRPLVAPIGGANSRRGELRRLSIRATYGYDMGAKTNRISLDMLVGVKTIMPELGCRFLG